MADHPVWYVGDRNPAASDTVTINGVPVDLTGKTVTFKMRAVGSPTLKVNQAVSTKDASGNWTYNWGANDLDTAGKYLVWVTVDMGGGALETVSEDLITVAAHSTAAYVEVEEFKRTLNITSGFADDDIRDVLLAASRSVDGICGTQFFLGIPGETRKYTAVSEEYLLIDDATAITAVAANGTSLVLDTNYMRAGNGIGYPYSVLRSLSGYTFPRNIINGVSVTGTFGWTAPPADVKQATTILAARLFKRSREAAFGVVGFDLDGGAVRIPGRDPDVENLLAPYMRSGMIE